MELIIGALYNYGFYKNVELVACDIQSGEALLKDKNGNTKKIFLDLFRKYGTFISLPKENKNANTSR